MTRARRWFAAASALGRVLAGRRLATVVEHGPWVSKRRHALGAALVRLGMPLMWALDTGVRVQPLAGWWRAECRAYAALYGLRPRRSGRWLALPRLPGVPLAERLAQAGGGPCESWLYAAGQALAGLHRAGLSHGDATPANVLIDEEGAARWFDFETTHTPRRRPERRRADDLRALILGVAHRAPSDALERWLLAVLAGYGEPAAAHWLRAELHAPRALPYHLAQAPLDWARYTAVQACLI